MKRMTIAIAAVVLLMSAGGQAAKKAPEKAPPAKPADVAADINAPRPDARTISFETREGTWMSVDVSPDGTTIAFDLLGDIYTVPMAGGAARALTRGPAWDLHPRFAPDGKTIVFTSDRNGMENLWLMDADGRNPRPLTEVKDAYVRSAAWTPDGNYVVARKEDAKRAGIPPVELWMYHREGGSGIKIVSSDDLNNASGPVASRDGRFIYFAARERRFSYEPDLRGGLWSIVRYDRTTGESVPLTTGFGGAARPAISPDGKLLTFVSRRDADTVLVARDLDTGAERILTRRLTRDDQEGFAQMDVWPNYAFTPDGQSLVFADHGQLVRLGLARLDAQVIPFTANVELALAPHVSWQDKVETDAVSARILRWPSQSPDGRWVAFDAFGRIWLQELSANGKTLGAPRRLTPESTSLPAREYAPAFSPDGQWIAYVTWSDAEGGHVWKTAMPASSAGIGGAAPVAPERLTRSAGHYANPSWSPKSDRLAIVRGSGLEFRGQQPEDENFFEIRWLEAAGGDTQYVTTVKLAESMKFHPQAFWNADGTRLYCRDPIERKKPTDDPKNDLVSVRLDGTDRKRHLRLPPVDDVVPSPDERWVVFTSRDNVYVAALPNIQAKEPPEIGLKEGSVPVWRLSDAAGGYVGWADGGKAITWALGSTFHRLSVADAIKFVEEQKRKAAEKEKEKKKDSKKPEAAKPEEPEPKVPKSQEIELRLSMPRSVPEGTVALTGARVVTMNGNDQVLDNATIVITGNRIAAVGPTAAVPPGAKTIDARGKTIIPGLVDTHAHLHYSSFEIFPETKWEYIANLAYGVTTVYDPSAPSLDVFAQGEMVESGAMTGPRVYSSGDVLYGGQQADIFAEVTSQEDALRQVRRMKAYGARMIKVYQQPRRDVRMWFAEACRKEHMLLTAEGAGELQTDLTMVLDGFTAFEHSLPYELRDDVVQLLARSGVYYTPTLIVSYGGPTAENYFWQTANPHEDAKLNRFVPHRSFDVLARRHPWIAPDEYQFPNVARGAGAVVRAGGHVTLGAHGQLQGLGADWELWALAGEGGRTSDAGVVAGDGKSPTGALSPVQALRAATIDSARKIGYGSDLGSIEPGKLADLVVLDGDPLADIHATRSVRWVIKNGEVYDAETMKEEWPKERPLPPFFWKSGGE